MKKHSPGKSTAILVAIIVGMLCAAAAIKLARGQEFPRLECQGDVCTISRAELFRLIKDTGEEYALRLCGWAQAR